MHYSQFVIHIWAAVLAVRSKLATAVRQKLKTAGASAGRSAVFVFARTAFGKAFHYHPGRKVVTGDSFANKILSEHSDFNKRNIAILLRSNY